MRSKYNINDVDGKYSDCFAMNRYRCTAWDEFYCKKEGKCNFYVPKDEHIKRVKEKNQRCIDLGIEIWYYVKGFSNISYFNK